MMQEIYVWLGAVALVAVYWLVGTLDAQDQAATAQHKAETIAAAKAEYKRQQWAALEAESVRLTFPVAAYGR